MNYLEGQILVLQARILRDHAHIVSGAYKLDRTDRGCEKSKEHPTGWIPLTEEEQLQKWLGIMDNHMKWMNECVEQLARSNK